MRKNRGKARQRGPGGNMDTVKVLVNQLIIFVIYLAVGFLLEKGKLVTKKNSSALTSFLLYAVLPCLIVKAFMQPGSPEKTKELLWSLLLAALALALAMVISHLVFKKDPISDFGSSFSNAGLMGLPLIAAVLGSDAAFYTAGMVAMLNVLQWTYGQSLITGNWSELQPKKIIKNPLIIAFVIGLLVYFLQIPLPVQAVSTINSLASCSAPIAMVIIGVYLGGMKPAALKDKSIWVCSFVRLIIIPAATLLLFALFKNLPVVLRMAIFISAMAPVGSNIAIYVERQGKDTAQATALVCLSTLLCLLTMPVMLMAATSLWG